jgi:hypothetical protein
MAHKSFFELTDYRATTMSDVKWDMETGEPSFPDEILGVMEDDMETMNKSDVLRNNLMQQQIEIEKQISVLEGQLQRQKEYLAKIEGGIDVLDELLKK